MPLLGESLLKMNPMSPSFSSSTTRFRAQVTIRSVMSCFVREVTNRGDSGSPFEVHRFPWNGKPTFDLRANGDIFNILPQSVSQKPVQFMATVETNVLPEKTRADPELDFPFHDPSSRSVRTRTFFLAHSTSGLTWVPAAILEILYLDPVVLEEEFDLLWPGHV